MNSLHNSADKVLIFSSYNQISDRMKSPLIRQPKSPNLIVFGCSVISLPFNGPSMAISSDILRHKTILVKEIIEKRET